jgi:hypothetical protein
MVNKSLHKILKNNSLLFILFLTYASEIKEGKIMNEDINEEYMIQSKILDVFKFLLLP